MQEIDPKMVTVTQMRRDFDIFKDILATEGEAWIMKNQEILCVALSPEKYQNIKTSKKRSKVKQTVEEILNMQKKYKTPKGATPLSEYVVNMREEQAKKWKRQ